MDEFKKIIANIVRTSLNTLSLVFSELERKLEEARKEILAIESKQPLSNIDQQNLSLYYKELTEAEKLMKDSRLQLQQLQERIIELEKSEMIM